jgi:hypothetical protein
MGKDAFNSRSSCPLLRGLRGMAQVAALSGAAQLLSKMIIGKRAHQFFIV